MKTQLFKRTCLLLTGLTMAATGTQAQGFQLTATNWGVPIGGYYGATGNWGFNAAGASASASYYTNSQTWGLMDINSDGKQDLVVCAQNDSNGDDKSFTSGGNRFWKIYMGSASGFAPTATNWTVPSGGYQDNAGSWGFNALGGVASASYYMNSQTWGLMDMNGDGKADLVVCGQNDANTDMKVFSPISNPYWMVYMNTGTGFSTTAVNWPVPTGGYNGYNGNWGFNALSGNATASSYAGSQTWSTMDINGDGKPDLIVHAQNDANTDDKIFVSAGNPCWKVFLNNGTGFATTATNWPVPTGGYYGYNGNWGFNAIGASASASYYAGSQSWSTMDMNGDGKPDLVAHAQNDASGDDIVFSASGSAHWKVYLNNGTGFAASATNWNVPAGGYQGPTSSWGFNASAASASASYYTNSQTWSTMDIDGDGKPDLVVHAQNDSNSDDKVFSPASSPYWKVYTNSGTGFSTAALNWPVPTGGYQGPTSSWGFNASAASASASYYTNSQTWSVIDLNNDKKPDLVVHAQNDANTDDKVFTPNSPYWKVYINSSTVGIKTNGEKTGKDLIIFPNPSNGKFALMLSSKPELTSIEVYNIMGEKVLQCSGTHEFDLSTFSKGTYVAIISDGTDTFTKKLIVQ